MYKIFFIIFLTLSVLAQAQKVDALTQMPQFQQTTSTPNKPTKPTTPATPTTPNNPTSPIPASPTQPTPAPSQQAVSPSVQFLRETTTTPYKTSRKITNQRHKATRQGVKSLKKKNYSEAVTGFRNALKADSSYATAQYNAAIAHAGLQQNDSALTYYHKLCENSSATSQQRANAHYNSGNIHLRKALAARDTGGYDGQSLQTAISEYKSSLRLNPSNKEAQHNLSLARQLLRPEQGGGGGGGQNQQQQNNQDQNQQQQNQGQNQDQNKDQQQNQNQDQQQDQQQGQQNKKDRQQQEQRRREAEQMLNAMKNNEQQTMKAVRMKEAEKERRQGRPARIEKDW